MFATREAFRATGGFDETLFGAEDAAMCWALKREGRFTDNRPANPRKTTAAIRDFLKNEGRILIDPQGHLTEGGGIPRPFVDGGREEMAACRQAFGAYFDTRRRWRSDRQIKRAVRMLGERTDNGWIVLEARS